MPAYPRRGWHPRPRTAETALQAADRRMPAPVTPCVRRVGWRCSEVAVLNAGVRRGDALRKRRPGGVWARASPPWRRLR